MEVGRVWAAIDLKTEDFKAGLDKARSGLEGLDSKMKDIGKGMGKVGKVLTAGITAPIVAIGAIATKTGMDFEAAMSEVGAISGATGDDLKALEDMAKEMGRTTKFSASEAAEGLKYMAMAGWDTQQQLDGLPGVLNLAAASGEDLGTVSDIVTDAMTAFGMEAAQAGEFADVLAAAASNSNTNVSMLGESFKYVAPVAGALGFEAKDAATALGLMANAGIKGSQAGTAMRTLLTNLVKPTKESGTAMDALGISLTDADGNMKELSDVMGDLREAFHDLDPGQQAFYAAQIAGQQGMSGLLAIVNAAEDDFNDLSGAINNSTGEAERMATEMQDNLAGRLTELKSALEGLALQIYDVMLPALEGFVAIVQRVVDWFAELSPGIQRAIVVVGALAAAIGPVLVGLAGLIVSITNIMPIITALGPIIGGIATGPIALIVAAIVGVIAMWNKWGDSIKEFVSGAISKIDGFRDRVQDILSGVEDAILGPFKRAGEKLGNITESIKGKLNKINPFARHSPSLVEQVQKGTEQMLRDFNRLETDININPVARRVGQVDRGRIEVGGRVEIHLSGGGAQHLSEKAIADAVTAQIVGSIADGDRRIPNRVRLLPI